MKPSTKPLCTLSKKQANKCCINANCNITAFICKYCDDDQCQNRHNHDGKLQICTWSSIIPIIQQCNSTEMNPEVVEVINKLTKQVQKIILDLRNILKKQINELQKLSKVKLNDNGIDKIIENINNKQYQLIYGSSIKKLHTFFKNKSTIKQVQKQKIDQKIYYDNLMNDISLTFSYLNKQKQSKNVQIQPILENPKKQQINSPKKQQISPQIPLIKVDSSKSNSGITQITPPKEVKVTTGITQTSGLFKSGSTTRMTGSKVDLNKSQILEQKNNKSQIKQHKITASYADTLYEKGNEHLKQQNYDTALILFYRAIQNDKDYYKAYDAIIKIIKIQKRQSIFISQLFQDFQDLKIKSAKFVLIAKIYINESQFQPAINILKNALKCDSTSAVIYNHLGIIYLRKQNYDLSLQNFNLAIKYYPAYSNAYSNIGVIYQRYNNNQKALIYFAQAIQVDNKNQMPYTNRVRYYIQARMYPQALADLNKLIELDPNDSSYYKLRASVNVSLFRLKQAQSDTRICQKLEINKMFSW